MHVSLRLSIALGPIALASLVAACSSDVAVGTAPTASTGDAGADAAPAADAAPPGAVLVDASTTDARTDATGASTETTEGGAPGQIADSGPPDGGVPGATVLARRLTHPSTIALDAQRVYVAEGEVSSTGPGQLLTVPLAGGAPSVIAPGPVNAIAVDATRVYWSAGSAVKSMPIAGGAVTTLASAYTYARAIEVDATALYFLDVANGGTSLADGGFVTSSAARKVPLGGGAVVDLATNLLMPSAIAIDDADVYWTEGLPQPATGASNTAVRKVPKAGGAVGTVADQKDMPAFLSLPPCALAIQGQSLYVTAWNTSLVRIPTAGGATTVISDGPALNATIVTDDSYVYWTVPGSEIRRAPLAGGPTVVIAKGNATQGLAVDADAVYFTFDDETDGAVLRVAKADIPTR